MDEKGRIIAGHGRVLAAKSLSLESVPVMVVSGWTEAEKNAYCVADNQIAARATWDLEQLHGEIASLVAADFDLDFLGFDSAALEDLLGWASKIALGDPEAVPEPPVTPVSKLDNVWLLGRHRLVCGDCTDAKMVALALGGLTPSLMVADPPYGVNYDPAWRITAST